MKRKLFYLSLLVAAAFTGCTKSDVDDATAGGTQSSDVGYVAVSIMQVPDDASRAEGDTPVAEPEFEDGSTAESIAREGLFFIYGANRQGTTQRVTFSGNSKPADNIDHIERIYDAVLIVDGEQTDGGWDNMSLLCVLNAPKDLDGITTLDAFLDKVADYSQHDPYQFVMSNSVYRTESGASSTTVVGASLKGHIAKSAPEAIANPAKVYVERVLAKVRVSTPTAMDNSVGAKPVVDGKEKQLKIVVKGAEIANIAEQAYLYKRFTTLGDNFGLWRWSDPARFRSYWESIPTLKTYDIDGKAFGDGVMGLKNKSYTQINDATLGCPVVNDAEGKPMLSKEIEEYVLPNTSASDETAVLVTAQLMDGDDPADLAYIRGGYTTSNGAMNVVLNHVVSKFNYYKFVGAKPGSGETDDKTNVEHYRQINETDFKWVNNNDLPIAKTEGEGENKVTIPTQRATGLKDYEVVAQLKDENETLYVISRENGKPKADVAPNGGARINRYLKAYYESEEKIPTSTQDNLAVENSPLSEAVRYRARIFKDGMCYYYENIDMTDLARERAVNDSSLANITDHMFEGVVRNHVYNVTLSAIQGIGTPIFDPDDVIIPQIPQGEEAFYLAAQVHVQAWKIVSQNVSFDGQE